MLYTSNVWYIIYLLYYWWLVPRSAARAGRLQGRRVRKKVRADTRRLVTSHVHYTIIILSSCRYIIYRYIYNISIWYIPWQQYRQYYAATDTSRACTSAFTRVRSAGGCTFFPPPSLSGSGTQYDAITQFSVHTVATSYRR